jgi:galactosylceramidase
MNSIKCKILAPGLLIFLLGLATLTAATTIPINGNDEGRVFEGIGAVSAGANTRLLIDYQEPYRGDILDFLFKPKFGASFQHLKVEIGGGTNSTSGAEPSHTITQAELSSPVSRGYEFWFMKEARNRDPNILLDCLPWAFPYWLESRFSQDTSDYFVAFLEVARAQWDLELDWVAAAQNESGTDLSWVTYGLRPTMDAQGFSNVHIQSPDNVWAYWDVFNEFITHPAYDVVVEAVGYHYIDQGSHYPSASVIATGKPLWCSEDSVGGGSWANAIEMVARMNRLYINGKITKMEIWCPVDSCADGVLYGGVGAMEADSPWSGHYAVRPAIWGTAHYTQFTEPGWIYIESGCGTLSGNGNYATLKDPATSDWSIILYAQNAESLTFQLSGGLSAADVKVWKSTSSNMFVQQSSIPQSSGQFTINCSADSLYSLTTTTGQQKGQAINPIPAAADFPYPYTEDFESYAVGVTPKYLSDMQGTFEVAQCNGGRTGKCVQQMVPQVGYTWAWDWCNPHVPMTIIPHDTALSNYQISVDLYIESGEVYAAARKGSTQTDGGYAFVIDKNGNWRLSYDDVTLSSNIIEQGTVTPFDGNIWHNIKVSCIDSQINAYLDGRLLCSVQDNRRSNGQAYFGSSFDLNQFDNISVTPAGPPSPWIKLDQTDPSLIWSTWWWTWSSSEYYGGSCKYTEVVDQTAQFPFTGVAGRIIGSKRNDLGEIDIYVDDVFQTTVDCYSDTTEHQVILYETNILPFGPHTIRVEVTGNQNPASTGFEIILDAFSYASSLAGACPLKKNFALTSIPSASSIWSVDYTAEKANDANSETRWNSAGADVNGSWLQLDFGQEVTFDRTKLTQFDDRILSYKIQYYDGPWKDAYAGGQLGSESTNIFPAVTGTKARLYIETATTCPSIYEFEVYSAQADMHDDGRVNFADFVWLCRQWLEINCDQSCNCQGADLFHDGKVDLQDFGTLSGQYNP